MVEIRDVQGHAGLVLLDMRQPVGYNDKARRYGVLPHVWWERQRGTLQVMTDDFRSQAQAAAPVVGSTVEGLVTGITKFGAFVELPDGSTGLVHISEVADSYVADVHQFVKEHERVQVKILGLNDKGKYDLSMKQVGRSEPPAAPARGRGSKRGRNEGSGNDNFEDKLSRFMKESEERLLDLKRNTEAKRGRGRAR